MTRYKDKMLAGELFAYDDTELTAERLAAALLMERYNATSVGAPGQRVSLLRDLLGSVGESIEVRSPFHCLYGRNIHLAEDVFVNYGGVFLDTACIEIGPRTLIGPYVQLLTATHPLEAELRRKGYEFGAAITIGSNVWIGGGAIVCPGVTIGDDAVVGAGSVVTKDVPAGVVVYGNPARVVRSLPSGEVRPTAPISGRSE
ncbi:sugar O-acetyltransferase [Streptomyces sp. APSN-46.1]|uniref:sugar O-acetyltransferase n=1 Tax=Streptomyces sp. APSN-46.1 TaxID=2929049 RepID=UPI001FB302B0|nr:sugar O-acetyltransferase [Streptomyces sp. APSN-46.1]MCJ1681159.1 sugar O-acetyltransferase [Streptomyces sp. APSN-46.1]